MESVGVDLIVEVGAYMVQNVMSAFGIPVLVGNPKY